MTFPFSNGRASGADYARRIASLNMADDEQPTAG